jgi:hypothetical protein
MLTTKLGAVLASLAVSAAATAVLAASPAQAATATTAASLDISGKTDVKGVFGDYIGYLDASVTDSNGAAVSTGTANLQAKFPGKDWKTVKTDATPSYVDFGSYGSHAHGNVKYRLQYVGDSTYASSVSNVVTVGTYWDLNDSGACPRGCFLSGKLAPKAKHHKVTIQVKHGSWKRYKVVHTDSRSKYRAGVEATRGTGTKYRILVGGTKHLLKTKSGVYRAVRY